MSRGRFRLVSGLLPESALQMGLFLAKVRRAGTVRRALRARAELGTRQATCVSVMRPLWHYPLSTFCAAAESAVGWLLAIFASSFLGLWLGIWIGSGEVPDFDSIVSGEVASFDWIASGAVFLILALVWCPELLILFGLTVLLWYVPHRYESLRLRVGAAVVNCLAWVGFCAWASRSLPRW